MLFYRWHHLNESQTHAMYCLWFISIIVVAGILMMQLGKFMLTFFLMPRKMRLNGSVACEKMLYVQLLLIQYFLF